MSSRGRRVLRIAGIALGVLVLGSGIAAWILVGTDAGLRFALERAGGLLPGAFSTESVEGSLRGPMELRSVVFETASFEARIDRLRFDWHLRDLLRRRIDVLWLEASGIRIRRNRPAPDGAPVDPLVDLDLGWDVRVRRSEITDIEIVPAGGGEPIRIRSVELEGRLASGRLRLDALKASGPDFSLDAAGELTPSGSWPLDLDVSWSVDLGGRRLAGAGTLGGTLRDLRLEQTLTEPVAAHLAAVLHDPLAEPSIEAELTTDGSPLQELVPDAPAGRLGGSVRAEGSLSALSGRVDLEVASPGYGVLHARGRWSGSGERWTVAPLSVSTPDGSLEGTLELVYVASARPELDIEARWDALAWPLEGPPAIRSTGGEAQLTGDLEHWNVRLAGELSIPQTLEGRLELAGTASRTALAVRSATYHTLGGSIGASGRVSWQTRPTWRFELAGRDLDPSGWLAGASGELDIEAGLWGSVENEEATGALEPVSISGRLAGQPIEGRIEAVRYRGRHVTLDEASFDWSGARGSADGVVTEPLDLTWQASVPDLRLLSTAAGGSFDGSGHVSGSYAAPTVRATLAAERGAWGELVVGSLSAELALGFEPGSPVELDLSATEVAIGEHELGRVDATADGRAGEHRLKVVVGGEDLALDAAATGRLIAGPAWAGAIRQMKLDAPQLGTWSLENPARLEVSAEAASVEAFRWASTSGARISLTADWQAAGSWSLDGLLEDVPLGLLAGAWVPEDTAIVGTASGEIAARAVEAHAITGEGRLTTGPARIEYAGNEVEPATLAVQAGELRFTAREDSFDAHLALELREAGRIEGRLRVRAGLSVSAHAAALEIEGRLTAELSDLSGVQALVSGIDDTRGRLEADIDVSGTLGDPRLGGSMRLADGRATIPALGITLESVSLDAADSGPSAVHVEGGATSGAGRITIDGRIDFDPSAANSVALDIGGERFLAVDTDTARVVVTPDLRATYGGEVARVEGEVRVVEADIELSEEQEREQVVLSEDVVYVGEGPEAAAQDDQEQNLLDVEGRVRVTLGEEVEVRGRGIEARLEGSLLLIEEPQAPTRASGEIRIAEGTYQAYGQDLTVSQGRIFFGGGPVANPGLDVRAFRRADDGVVAGIDVGGTLESPQVSLWSEPPMAETEALSYLMLGRGLDEASEADGDLLAQAATSLGLKGGNLLGARLAERLGLEQVSVEAEQGRESASVVLGKYLSPRLYVAYGVGLFESLNTFRVRYLMSDHWWLEGETGTETSADLMYTIERGRGGRRTVPEEDAWKIEPRETAAGADGER